MRNLVKKLAAIFMTKNGMKEENQMVEVIIDIYFEGMKKLITVMVAQCEVAMVSGDKELAEIYTENMTRAKEEINFMVDSMYFEINAMNLIDRHNKEKNGFDFADMDRWVAYIRKMINLMFRESMCQPSLRAKLQLARLKALIQ